MENENPLTEFMKEHGLVMRICDGAVTICDGNCENCEEEE